MKYYENLAEMYVGDDVSPDFYGWVFPKYDHVAVGTGTVVNKTAIKQYQQATRCGGCPGRGAGRGVLWLGCWGWWVLVWARRAGPGCLLLAG